VQDHYMHELSVDDKLALMLPYLGAPAWSATRRRRSRPRSCGR